MKLTNRFGLPDPVVRSLTRSEYSKGNSNRSVTQLIDSPRVRILRKEHWDQMEEDVSEKLWSALGSAAHRLFEDNGDERHITEERLFVDVEGWSISGAIDVQRIYPDDTIGIFDYKMTSVWSVMAGKPEWERQLNCYGAIARHAKGAKVSTLAVIAILRDWRASDVGSRSNYPAAPIVEVSIPLWDDRTQDEYLVSRVKIHQDAEFKRLTGEDLPECSPDERWAKGDSFAVRKVGGKRALKVYESFDEATKALGEGQEIEVRPGKSTRCEGNYCGVRDWCNRYKGEEVS